MNVSPEHKGAATDCGAQPNYTYPHGPIQRHERGNEIFARAHWNCADFKRAVAAAFFLARRPQCS